MTEAPQTALLLGGDHTELGKIATAQIGPDIAVALSRGKFPKGYPYLDANEDAVLAAAVGSTALLAVADGHSGFDAAQAAVKALCAAASTLLDMSQSDVTAAVHHGFTVARDAIVVALAEWDGPRRSSRTALVIGLAAEGQAAVACLGDTRAVLRSGRSARILVGGFSPFLDAGTSLDDVEVRTVSFAPGDQLVLLSDGLSDFLGADWLRKLSDIGKNAGSALEFVTAAVQGAFVGGAGDNVTVGSLGPGLETVQ